MGQMKQLDIERQEAELEDQEDPFASRVISNETCQNLSNLAEAMRLKLDGWVTDGAVLNAAIDLYFSLDRDIVKHLDSSRSTHSTH